MADYDLVVIGAGATGLGAARGARRAGRRVALVEADRPVAVSAILTLNNSAEQTMMYNGCNR